MRVKGSMKCCVVCCIVKKGAGHLYCIKWFALVVFYWSKGRKTICIIQLASRRGHYESLMYFSFSVPPFLSVSVSLCISSPFLCPLSLHSLALIQSVLGNNCFFLYFRAIISVDSCSKEESVYSYIFRTHVVKHRWK